MTPFEWVRSKYLILFQSPRGYFVEDRDLGDRFYVTKEQAELGAKQ